MFFNEHVAWDNLYDTQFSGKAIGDIVDACEYLIPFMCDPWNIKQEDMQEMLKHYEEREMYERCIDVHNAINSGAYAS